MAKSKAKENQPEVAKAPELRVRVRWDELPTMARTIWGEARGEEFEGQLAVACVILNRVLKSTWYGEGIEAVCRKRWQFSCWNSDDPNRQKMLNAQPDGRAMQACIHAALLAARAAGTGADPSHGATHYHAKNIDPPSWAEGLEPVAEIGGHLFYSGVD